MNSTYLLTSPQANFPCAEIQHFLKGHMRKVLMFLHGDFRYTIPLVIGHLGCVVYCDPPYLPASETAILRLTASHLLMKITVTWLRCFHTSTTMQKYHLSYLAVTHAETHQIYYPFNLKLSTFGAQWGQNSQPCWRGYRYSACLRLLWECGRWLS
jgi:site-specific DNA-adenine methylase